MDGKVYLFLFPFYFAFCPLQRLLVDLLPIIPRASKDALYRLNYVVFLEVSLSISMLLQLVNVCMMIEDIYVHHYKIQAQNGKH